MSLKQKVFTPLALTVAGAIMITPAFAAKKPQAKSRVSPVVTPVAWAPNVEDVQVFNETTSFTEILNNKVELSRSPASIAPLARVIALKRDLGLSQEQSNKAAQDIVLNGGTNSGLSEGMILSVVRKVPIIDPYRENAQSELEIEFAKVKIIHVQKEIAVARLDEIAPIDEGMFLGTRGILIGDFVTRGK